MKKSSLKLPFADKILKIVAILYTIISLLLLLFPTYWMIISSFKDPVSQYKNPPDFIPTVPYKYVVQVDYENEQWADDKKDVFEYDAQLLLWQVLGSTEAKVSNIGSVEILANVDGQIKGTASLSKADFQIHKEEFWANAIIKNNDVEKRIKNLLKSGYVNYKYKGFSSSEKMKVNEHTTVFKDYLSENAGISGKISTVEYCSSWKDMFNNYKIALNAPVRMGMENGLIKPIGNTVYIAIVSLVLMISVSGLAAYSLSKLLPKKLRMPLLMVVLISGMVPSTVTLIPQFQLMENLGLTNTFTAVFIAGLCNFTAVLLFKGTFDNLPTAMIEAAKIDGAGDVRIFFQFALPAARGVVAVLSLTHFVGTWNDYFWPMIVIRDTEKYTVSMVMNSILNANGGTGIDYGVALALGFIISIPTLLIFMFAQKWLDYGFDYSGFKG